MRTALVGRERELDVLLGCLGESQQGRANLVVCVGEPGIGKTRLVEELTGQARDRGVLTAWGRTASTDGAPPYWPWREVLRALETAGLATQDTLADVVASGVEPSLEERVRRFDEVARVVLGAARSRPLLVVLDDADGADEASQLLVQYLARTARNDPLLVVVCCRETAGPLAALAQEPNTTQVELRGLERAAVGEQVDGIVGRAASDAELAAVYNATAGNPFFVGELARQLADGSTRPGAVPRSVLDAIGQRIGRLSADCAASLRAAALLGTRFAVTLVAAMTGRNLGDCLTSLDEAARAALVLEDGAPGERRFAHDLVRDAIVAGLGSAQRVTLHRRAAKAIEAQVADTEAMVFDLAHHWAEAAIDGDRAVAVTWTERAGRKAMRLHAYEDGRRWYGRALELGEGVLDEVARCRLMTAYAGAQCLSSDFNGALQTCVHAVDLAVRIGRPDLAGEAALVPEPTFDEGIDRVIRALCERALAVLDGAPAALRARVLAQYAWVCDYLCDLDAAYPAVEQALVLAEASGDPTALEAALTAHHMVRAGPDGLAEREDNADRMWALGIRTGRANACLSASEWRFDAASERGDLAQAARELETIGRWAALVGGPMAQWRLLRCRAMLAQARGRYADAFRLGTQAFGTLSATGFPQAYLLWGGLLSIHVPSHRAHHRVTGDRRDHRRRRHPAELACGRCHPDPGTGEPAGRGGSTAGGRRHLPPARPGLGVAGIAPRHALHLGGGHCDRPGDRGGRRRGDLARQARRLAWAPRRQRPLRDGVRRPRRAPSRSRGRTPRARRRCDRRTRAGGEGCTENSAEGLPRRGRVRARLGTRPSLGAR